MEETTLQEILESTVAVARGLEALQSEHEALLTDYYASENIDSSEAGSQRESSFIRELSSEELLWSGGGGGGGEETEGGGGEEGWSEELEALIRQEQQTAVNESLQRLQTGLNEAKLMLMLANYINTLESDKQKLKAQVKRLCSENNWLRKELTDHQQLLQETEITLAKVKEEKENMEFLLDHHKKDGRREREQSPAMDVDNQEEEAEGVMHNASGALVGGASSDNHLGGHGEGVDYEVPENIKTLHHLALQYVNQGKPDIAVPLCKKAIIELEQKKGRDNPDLASMLNILAVIHREQGKLKEATKVLHETLEIRERVLGPHHQAVASTLNNLSVLYGKCGDYKTAEPFCRKALEIRQRLLGATHPDVAKQFINLAILCTHLGRYDEVEYYYQRALEIYQTEFGPDDPNVAKTMSNLASCYLKQGKYKAAESIYKKVLSTVQSGSADPPAQVMTTSPTPEPPDSPGSHDREAWSPLRGGRDESFGGWHKVAAVHSPTVSSTLRSLSAVYREQGRVETAQELDKLTGEKVLNKSQQDRIAELLSATSEASESPSPSPTPSAKMQAYQQKQGSRASLSLSVRRLFRLKGSDLPEDS